MSRQRYNEARSDIFDYIEMFYNPAALCSCLQ